MRASGRLEEFANNAAIASVRVKGCKVFSPVVVVFPNNIAAIEGYDDLPFSVEDIEAVFQTAANLKQRSQSTWSWFVDRE